MFTYESCGCVRDKSGAIVPPLCGSRLVHGMRWAEALRESAAYRQRRVREVLAFAGPQDGLAREAAAYGIVPMVSR